MALKLYYNNMSPPSRSVLMTIKELGIDVDYEVVNLGGGDHLKPEFLKMNSQHTVPTLQDGDFSVWDSHAINAYLVTKYGKNDSLYPKDPEKRAVVDQRLHFDSSVLFPRLAAIVSPILREGAKSVPKEKADAVAAGYTFLESFFHGQPYVAGNNLTIADFNIATTITQLNVLVPLASNRYPQVTKWLSLLQGHPTFAESNQEGLDIFDKFIKSKLS